MTQKDSDLDTAQIVVTAPGLGSDTVELLALVDKEINEVFDPYFKKFAGSGLASYEKVVIRTYLMGKLMGKMHENKEKISN